MARIVTTSYRYKRPPRKRRKAVALEVPAIVTGDSKRSPKLPTEPAGGSPTNDDAKSAIVTARKPTSGRFGTAPDLTPEEHQRRGDAADALFQELVRLAAQDRP